MDQKIKIAVIGGTGKSGKYLVKQLLEQGFPIKILLRNPSNFQINNPLIETVKGDITDYESALSLITGCQTVISTLGQTKEQKPVFSKAAANIVKAMNAVNISRYIVLTGMVLDTPTDKKSLRTKILSGMMKLMFPAIIADKRKEYTILSESNLDWTVVRVPLIEQTDESRAFKTSLTDCPGSKISTTDLAGFLIDQVTDRTFVRKAPFLANV